MKPKSAIAKGKILEDFIAERLVKSGLDSRSLRQKGSGNGIAKGDVNNNLGLCIEAKNTKNCSINDFWAQAKKESLGAQIPIVVWHKNNIPLDESLVVVDWKFFEELLLAWVGYTPESNSNIPKWKLLKLKEDINSVLKEL